MHRIRGRLSRSSPKMGVCERRSVRALVHNEAGLYCFLRHDDGYIGVLGGGIGHGEKLLHALEREVREESGCVLRNIKDLGVVVEIRRDPSGLLIPRKEIGYYYSAEVERVEKPNPDFMEFVLGATPVWLSIEEARELFEAQKLRQEREKKPGKSAVRGLVLLNVAQGATLPKTL